MYKSKPWLKFYGDVPTSIDYPTTTMYEELMKIVEKYPHSVAYDFFDTTATYQKFAEEIEQCARALSALGLQKGDRITISMPTSPQGVICVYAANKLGAASSMIHPLSPPKEIEFYLNDSESAFALTLDAFYPAFNKAMDSTGLKTLILSRIPDYLPFPKNVLFGLTKGRKIAKVPPDPKVRWWHELMQGSYPEAEKAPMDSDDLAVIMYSGGTTGTPKGIMLSNRTFVAYSKQAGAWVNLSSEDSILGILPIFHGFGLGVCINTFLMNGGKVVLVPQFSADVMAKLIKKKRPSYIVGIPTIYDALSNNKTFLTADLSCLKGAFCGADTLSRSLKEKFEGNVRQAGGDIVIQEGYGLTETLTAIMCMPQSEYREGSIGIPFPDMDAKVVKLGTTEEAPVGEEGELCIHGPIVMQGYLNRPEETADTLKEHADGKAWLHTGDITTMDEDGFFYFKLRLKRMIKSSGMNVYPFQIEEVLLQHPQVEQACVVGVPDKTQVERVKGFVVLGDPSMTGADMEEELIAHCRENLIKWSCPREIEFRTELPMTAIGKVDFKKLQDESR